MREGIIKNRLNHKGLMNLRTNRKIGDRAFSVAALRALESAADRLETLAFDCFIQEQTEEFSVSCCLHREHYAVAGLA